MSIRQFVLRETTLKPIERLIIFLLLDEGDQPSQFAIARSLAVGRSTVERSIVRLMQMNVLVKVSERYTAYRLTPSDTWVLKRTRK